MTPTHATKGGRRYRYYVSAETPADAERVCSVPAQVIERTILEAVRITVDQPHLEDHALLVAHLRRVEIEPSELVVRLADEQAIRLPRQLPSSRRHHQMHHPAGTIARLMRAETRATLLESIAKARRWVDEIASGAMADVAAIASREGSKARAVSKIISLAWLSPDIVEAAIAGRLPHGTGVRELVDAPILWKRQRSVIGFE